MWNFANTMGHPGHLMSPFATQKRDFSLNISSVPVLPGKTFSNPNFVNQHNPSVHCYRNNFILTPIQKNSHTDSSNVKHTATPHKENNALVNSSQSIVDKVKENHIEVVKPNCEVENVREPVTCNSRKRSNKHRRHRRARTPGKNSKQHVNKQQISDMMNVDLEIEPSISVSDISMSPKAPNNSYKLTDFIIERPNKTKPIKIEESRCDLNQPIPIFSAEISISPICIGKLCARERQPSIAESEDSFIVFDSGTDDELEFSEDSEEESEYETEDEVDSPSVIPHKKVRFANDTDLCVVHPMVQWSFAYQQARKGPWEEYARDRDRFSKRISQMEKIIAPVFDSRHRENVYRERFKEKTFAF